MIEILEYIDFLSFPIFEIYTSDLRIKSIFSIKGTITTDNSHFVSYLCGFSENRQKKMGKLKIDFTNSLLHEIV